MKKYNTKKPYIGITGFMTREEVIAMLDLMLPLSRRLLMVGVLANWETLYKGTESGSYPNINNIPDIFTAHPLALNLIHYDTKKTDTLCDQLSALTTLCGGNLHGFQLNFTWPPIDELAEYKSKCPNHVIVMVITPKAFEDILYSPQFLISKIEEYKGLIDYLLLDRSGGRGIPLDVKFMKEYLDVLYAKNLNVGIGIAGGLSSTTLNIIEPLVDKFTDLSIDAENKLRNVDDSLNLGFARDYLRRALQIFKEE